MTKKKKSLKEKKELEEPGPGIAMQSDGLTQPENMACIWGAKMVTRRLLEECQQLLEARKDSPGPAESNEVLLAPWFELSQILTYRTVK